MKERENFQYELTKNKNNNIEVLRGRFDSFKNILKEDNRIINSPQSTERIKDYANKAKQRVEILDKEAQRLREETRKNIEKQIDLADTSKSE
jgi:hypothetical protein